MLHLTYNIPLISTAPDLLVLWNIHDPFPENKGGKQIRLAIKQPPVRQETRK